MTWLSDAALDHLRDVADWPILSSERYEIVEPLARGGMGTVYLGRDRELDREVAIKVLSATRAGADEAKRLQLEARILARLEHPGIVPVYDVGCLEDGRLYYVMKLVRGARLDEHAAERPLAERLRLFARVCEPVAFANAHGVVHRDLKPDNVMVGPFGEVLVMDWGVAQIKEIEDWRLKIEDLTESVVGTRGYMAPEQARGEAVDARADVFALGGLLHFLLAGAAPDDRPPAGPRALRAIVAKARSAAAPDRYPDALSLAADVNRFLAGDPVSASPEGVVERTARFARKQRVAIALVITYLALRYLIAWMAP